MKDPQFIVVGAARAGTTALHHYLKQHPQIYLPDLKEPCFFCFAGQKLHYKKGKFAFAITDLKNYKKLFNEARQEQVTGEISTPYLYLHHQTIGNIKKYHSDPEHLKIIIVLRNPVDRAYSQYLWKVRDGREDLSFEEALKQEKRRIEENYSFDYFYSHRGLYYDQVKDYLDNFNSVKIILFDDFRSKFEETISGICNFLGVDDKFVFTRKEHVNVSAFPRFSTLGRLITVESRIKFRLLRYIPEDVRTGMKETFLKMNTSSVVPAPVSASVKIYLHEYYKDDILKLQSLTGIDLNRWVTY